MSSLFSEGNLIKKLENVTNTQDSIQSLSLWMLHHKAHYKQIVEQWLKCYLKAKSSSHQLALFYLANDIVQHSKRKSVNSFVGEFMGAVRSATKATADPKIIPTIQRVLNIWHDRHIYKQEFIVELRKLLGTETRSITKDVPYSCSELVNQIGNVSKAEEQTKTKQQTVATTNSNVDLTNSELLKDKLKDKSYGELYSKEFDEAVKSFDAVILTLEKEMKERKDLINKLEKAKLFNENKLTEVSSLIESYMQSEDELKLAAEKVVDASSKQTGSDASKTSLPLSNTQLNSVLSIIQQARLNSINSTANSSTGSLDQRLNKMMANSGQFSLALNPEGSMFSGYDPARQSGFNTAGYSDQYYLAPPPPPPPQLGESCEPADMDLGDSDDEANNQLKIPTGVGVGKSAEPLNIDMLGVEVDKPKSLPFIPSTVDLSSMFTILPPPPPPPVPPPPLEEFLASASASQEIDSYRPGNISMDNGNRSHPRHSPYQNSNWRPDNRHSPRHSNYHNNNHNNPNSNNRWKGNHGGGSWKR